MTQESSVVHGGAAPRDRLIVAAAETVIHDPAISSVFLVFPVDPSQGRGDAIQVTVSSATRSRASASAATPPRQSVHRDHTGWLWTLMQQTEGVR